MNIVHVTSEIIPFSYTKHSAEAIYSLASVTAGFGHSVIVASPFYTSIDIAKFNIKSTQVKIAVDVGFAVYEYEVFETTLDNVKYLFFKNDDLFNRVGIYGIEKYDYADNDIRFGTFSQAVLSYLTQENISVDVIHCHDWQTSLVPIYAKIIFKELSCKTILTLHTIESLGIYSKFTLEALNLPWELYNIDKSENNNNISFLKGGIAYADVVTTLSPNFSHELLYNQVSTGLEDVLINNADKVKGILCGVSDNMWDPEHDKNIVANYSAKNISGKKICKDEFCDDHNIDSSKILVSFMPYGISEESLSLVEKAMDELIGLNINLVIVIPRYADYKERIIELHKKYSNVVTVSGESRKDYSTVFAASDIMLIPAYYETSGVNALIAVKFGVIPVMRNTGALGDVAKKIQSELQGVSFNEFAVTPMIEALKNAVEYIENSSKNKIIEKLLSFNLSWEKSAKEYIKLYEHLKLNTI